MAAEIKGALEMINLWITIGLILLLSVGIRLLFNRNFFDKVIGIGLVSHAINLLLLLSGSNHPHEKTIGSPAFLPQESFESSVDALPQALILTAIVISFALTAFLLIYSIFAQKERAK